MMADTRTRTLERVLLALVLAVALFLRLAALDAFTTTDESVWHYRSQEFDRALETGERQYTYQSGHPGVVTMWLGTAAERAPWLEQPWPLDESLRPLMNDPAPAPGTGVPALTLGARRLVALVTWLAILALYPLLRQLFGRRIAILGTALVALDPFFLAHSRFHHLDGLLTAFVMVSVASLLVYQFRGRRIGYLLASAAAGALAVANKSPGILLVPWAGAALLLPALFAPAHKRRRELLLGAGALALWGAAAAALFYAIWPSMWLRAGWTLQHVFDVAKKYAETPHENGNYFWGVPVADPGLAFYPVAWAFRSSPWVWLGLAGLLAAWRDRQRRGLILLLLLPALLFAAAMTVGEKKFDRYLLPAFPMLDVLAAVGWVGLARLLRDRLPTGWQRWAPTAFLAGLAVALFALVWPTRPYYISYYNPIVGGSATAPQALMVGWGEGLDRVAAYLNSKPDAEDLVVCSWSPSELGNFFLGQTLDASLDYCPSEPDYYVFYQNSVQRDLMSPVSGHFLGVEEPEYVVRLSGIDYAWVYANTMYAEAEQQILEYILARADPGRDAIVLDGNAYLSRTYQGPVPMEEFIVPEREDAVRTRLQEVAAGRSHLWQVIYPDKGCGSRLARKILQQEATAVDEVTVDGVQAICYELPASPQFVPSRPAVTLGARFGAMTLLGYDVGEMAPGEPLRLRLYWQASEAVSPSYTVFAQLFGPGGEMRGQADSLPQGGARCTFTWEPGEVILDDHVFDVPADAPPGEYRALVGLYDAETMQRVQAIDAAGQHLGDEAVAIGGLRLPAP